jgi:hypothetical protein
VIVELRALATDTTGELNVLGEDGDSLGVDGAQVGVLEQADKISLGSLLKRRDGVGLEAQLGLEVLSDLANQPLERKLAEEEIRILLVLANLAQSHSPRAKAVRLLYPASRGRRLASSLGSESTPGGLATGRPASRLLGSCHAVLLSPFRLAC